MIDQFLITIAYIVPIGGVALSLFKRSHKYTLIMKNKLNDIKDRKKALVKILLAIVSGLFCSISCALWIVALWIPGIKLTNYCSILLFAPLVLIGLCMPVFVGLGKTVEAGAPSVTGTLNKLKSKVTNDYKFEASVNGKFERWPEAEILIIKKRLRKSAYSPTMPVGIFVLVFIARYMFLGERPDSLRLSILTAFFCIYLNLPDANN